MTFMRHLRVPLRRITVVADEITSKMKEIINKRLRGLGFSTLLVV